VLHACNSLYTPLPNKEMISYIHAVLLQLQHPTCTFMIHSNVKRFFEQVPLVSRGARPVLKDGQRLVVDRESF